MRCQECNYDLAGIDSDLCPECGAGTNTVRLPTPDTVFESLVRVLGTWFAAMAIVAIGALAITAWLQPRGAMRFTVGAVGMLPAFVMGVYLVFFAPHVRRLCYRGVRPRGYGPRAIFHLVVGLVGVWLAGRGLGDIVRVALHEVLSTRPRPSFVAMLDDFPRLIVGLLLVIFAGTLSRVWRAG